MLTVFFDIDGVLTTAHPDVDDAIRELLSRGCEVGIITASNRSIEDLRSAKWMPPVLLAYLEETEFRTYSSMTLTGGKMDISPHDSYGGRKGMQMNETAGKKPVLFDDDALVLYDASRVCLNGQFIWCYPFLNAEMIRNKIKI